MQAVTSPSGDGVFEALVNVSHHARAKTLQKRHSAPTDATSDAAVDAAERTWKACDKLELALASHRQAHIQYQQAANTARAAAGGKGASKSKAPRRLTTTTSGILSVLESGMAAMGVASELEVFTLRGAPRRSADGHSYGALPRDQRVTRAVARLIVLLRAVCARAAWEIQRDLVHDGAYAFGVERDVREGGFVTFMPSFDPLHQDVVEQYLGCVDFVVSTAHAVGLGWWAGVDAFQHVVGCRTPGDTSELFVARILRTPQLSVDCATRAVSESLVTADGRPISEDGSAAKGKGTTNGSAAGETNGHHRTSEILAVHGLRTPRMRPFAVMFELWSAEEAARVTTPCRTEKK